MKLPRVVVIGSTNTDLVVTVPHLPAPGETVLGGDLQVVAGGKGANQAVAAARCGAQVAFVGRIGTDAYGHQTRINLQIEGIDTAYLSETLGKPSGVALISVDAQTGENSIVVAPGANLALSPEDIHAAANIIQAADIVVLSLEIPLETVHEAVNFAHAAERTILLNPAPAQPLPPELLSKVSVLTPNEEELAALGGPEKILKAGVQTLVTTLGSAGARIQSNSEDTQIAAPLVNAVDTVAAGDCFTGALAVELARGSDLRNAVRFAVQAASLKVTRRGAQPGLPTRDDVLKFQSQL